VDTTIVLVLGLLVLVYLNVASRRRAQSRRAEMDQRLVPGADVVTTSGLHGTVDDVDDDGTVLLEIAPGWVTRWERAAVARILEPADEQPDDEDATTETPPSAGTVERAETVGTGEPGEDPQTVPEREPAAERSTDPTPEPGARPLPGTAPPDRA
jgi:preprotein translocase subunit YajC